jgi:hypothetical protein
MVKKTEDISVLYDTFASQKGLARTEQAHISGTRVNMSE